MATNLRPDLSSVYPWGCKVWVKRLDIGKLEPRAEECHFVGIDSESKGFWVYWPGKNRVGIERNVYFNEKDALDVEEVQIEGGNDIPTNLNSHQPSYLPQTHPTTDPPNDIAPDQSLNGPETQTIKSSAEKSNLPPHNKIARRNSLRGLPQFDNEQFGRGKRQPRPTASFVDVENVLDAEEMVDGDGVLNPKRKGVIDRGRVNIDEATLSVEEMESALAISEDEPSLREALSGDECQAWLNAIEAELAQMEKLNAWVPVIPPPGANIIPSLFVFRRKRNNKGSIV